MSNTLPQTAGALDEVVPELLGACRRGNVPCVEQLLIAHGGLELLRAATKEDTCPLAEAALSGNRALCEILIAQDSSQLQWRSSTGENVLFNAALSGSPQVFSLLVRVGGLNCSDHNAEGTSPIFFAAARGKLEVVRWICRKAPSSLRLTNNRRESFASIACKKGRMNIVRWLVSKKVDLSNYYIVSESPFLAACRAGQTEVVKFLAKSGMSLEPHRSTFTDKASNALAACACGGHDELVAFFLDQQIFSVQSYLDAIKLAISHNFPGIAMTILNALETSKAHHPFNFPTHALDAFIQKGHIRYATLVLEQFGSSDRFPNGLTPFLLPAIQSARLDLVKWVVNNDIARRDAHAFALKTLRRLSISKRPVSRYNSTAARQLTASILAQENLLPNVVQEALQGSRFHLLKWLVQALRLDAAAFIWPDTTALHAAAKAAHTEAAFFFAHDLGLPVNHPDKRGMRPLHIAAKAGATAVVRMLLISGADVVARDKRGRQPLGIALLHDRDITAHVLREAPLLHPIHIALAAHMHGLLVEKLRSGTLNPEEAIGQPGFGQDRVPTFVQLARNLIRAPTIACTNVNDRLEAVLRAIPNLSRPLRNGLLDTRDSDGEDDDHDDDDSDEDGGGVGDDGGTEVVGDDDDDDDDDDSVEDGAGNAAEHCACRADSETDLPRWEHGKDGEAEEEEEEGGENNPEANSGGGHQTTAQPNRSSSASMQESSSNNSNNSNNDDSDDNNNNNSKKRRRSSSREAQSSLRQLRIRKLGGQLVVPASTTQQELQRALADRLSTVALPSRDAPVVLSVLDLTLGPVPRHVSLDAMYTLQLAMSLSRPWCPQNHTLFPAKHREVVYRVLLCFGHTSLAHVPQENVFSILAHLTRQLLSSK